MFCAWHFRIFEKWSVSNAVVLKKLYNFIFFLNFFFSYEGHGKNIQNFSVEDIFYQRKAALVFKNIWNELNGIGEEFYLAHFFHKAYLKDDV